MFEDFMDLNGPEATQELLSPWSPNQRHHKKVTWDSHKFRDGDFQLGKWGSPQARWMGLFHGTSQLVGGSATPLKNMKVSWDDEIPNIWENKIDVPNHQPENG